MSDPMRDFLNSISTTSDNRGNTIVSSYTPSDPQNPIADLFNDVVTKRDRNGRIIDTGIIRSDGTTKWNNG